ncbi:MAG TPA: glycosyltransferase family 39 protein [Nitrobacter sp.]|nr:glycosyltransferase family 39 protein [Nitrobacter sp.]
MTDPISRQPKAPQFHSLRRLGAWFGASLNSRAGSGWFVFGFVVTHVVLWTIILTVLKSGQDVHFDVAEAYAWGQKFLLGYGKHPPLSGWVAGLWFKVFPVADWATYALAMTVTGCGMMICWLIALRVVDRRRALLSVVMLALYPIFNFKGYKYNVDLLQLVTLPLLVLAYLHAFDRRTVRSGVWLGLAGAAALLTKYWVLTMIGAVGIAALLHPARKAFLRSPAPWVGIGTMLVAMLPHLWWLKNVHFAPLIYAEDVYSLPNRAWATTLIIGYIKHNVALLLLPVVLAVAALAWPRHRWRDVWHAPRTFVAQAWSMRDRSSVNLTQAINIWIIQIVVAIGPPIGAFAFSIYMKTDWGISLFFLVPLALVAIPALRVERIAPLRLAAVWLAITLVVLGLAPRIAVYDETRRGSGVMAYSSRSILARQLTELWHERFHSPWRVVAGTTEIGEPMTFYSQDHPAPLTPGELWPSGLASLAEAKQQGFIGICDPTDARVKTCLAWMKVNAADGERVEVTTRRFFKGIAGTPTRWDVYIVPPAG